MILTKEKEKAFFFFFFNDRKPKADTSETLGVFLCAILSYVISITGD